jgi:hypothetical protein
MRARASQLNSTLGSKECCPSTYCKRQADDDYQEHHPQHDKDLSFPAETCCCPLQLCQKGVDVAGRKCVCALKRRMEGRTDNPTILKPDWEDQSWCKPQVLELVGHHSDSPLGVVKVHAGQPHKRCAPLAGHLLEVILLWMGRWVMCTHRFLWPVQLQVWSQRVALVMQAPQPFGPLHLAISTL